MRASPTVAASAVAVMKPIPGIVSSRRQACGGAMPRHQFNLDRADLPAQSLDHVGNQQQCLARQRRDRRCTASQHFDQLADVGTPLGCDDPVLRQVRPHRAHLRGPLPDQQMAGTVQHQDALRVGRFDRHEPHRRPRYRFTESVIWKSSAA